MARIETPILTGRDVHTPVYSNSCALRRKTRDIAEDEQSDGTSVFIRSNTGTTDWNPAAKRKHGPSDGPIPYPEASNYCLAHLTHEADDSWTWTALTWRRCSLFSWTRRTGRQVLSSCGHYRFSLFILVLAEALNSKQAVSGSKSVKLCKLPVTRVS